MLTRRTRLTKTRGYFETLKQFIAVAFRKEKTWLLCTDTAHGGILEWLPFAVDLSKKMSSATPEAKRAELYARPTAEDEEAEERHLNVDQARRRRLDGRA